MVAWDIWVLLSWFGLLLAWFFDYNSIIIIFCVLKKIWIHVKGLNCVGYIYIYMSEISYGIMIRKVSDQYDIVGLKLKPFKSSSILLYIYIYIYILH